MIITAHTYSTLSRFGCNASPLDSRQALTAAHSAAGWTVRTNKHRRSSSRPQFQSARGWSRLKVLLAEMLAAEVRVRCGDPLGAGALDLLLPFAKLIMVFGEFKQRHTIFCSFAASVGHAVVRHPVFCSADNQQSIKQDLQPLHPFLFCSTSSADESNDCGLQLAVS